MSGFISNLIARHAGSENTVQPRLPGKFESYAGPGAARDDDAVTNEQADEQPARQPKNKTTFTPPVEQPSKATEHTVPSPVRAATKLTEQMKQEDAVKAQQPTPQPSPSNVPVNAKQQPPVAPPLITPQNTIESITRQKEVVHHTELIQPAHVINQITTEPSINPDSIQPITINQQQDSGAQSPITGDEAGHLPIDPSWLQQLRKTLNNAWPVEQPKEDTPQVIKVNIGRIDVRAVTQSPAAVKATTSPKHVMSLEDFLKNKNGGAS
jgi:hypothetical protein